MRDAFALFEQGHATGPFVRQASREADRGLKRQHGCGGFVQIAKWRLSCQPGHVEGADGSATSANWRAKEGAHVRVAFRPAREFRGGLQVGDTQRPCPLGQGPEEPKPAGRVAKLAGLLFGHPRVDESRQDLRLIECRDSGEIGVRYIFGTGRHTLQRVGKVTAGGQEFTGDGHFSQIGEDSSRLFVHLYRPLTVGNPRTESSFVGIVPDGQRLCPLRTYFRHGQVPETSCVDAGKIVVSIGDDWLAGALTLWLAGALPDTEYRPGRRPQRRASGFRSFHPGGLSAGGGRRNSRARLPGRRPRADLSARGGGALQARRRRIRRDVCRQRQASECP